MPQTTARFLSILSHLSATFIHLPPDEVDGQIECGLGLIVEYLGIDRSSIAQFSPDGTELVVTHSYSAAGITPMPRVNIAPILPWYTDQIRRGHLVRLARVPEDLPPEASAEREALRKGSWPRSNLTLPFTVGERVQGGIGFGSFRHDVEWTDELVVRLQLVGEVFANALARKMALEKESRLREQLALAARVTLLGEMAASIAHEVNQPLCAILSNAQAVQAMLGSSRTEVGEVYQALEDICQDARRAAAVIDRVRRLFQMAPAERAVLDINGVIRELLTLMREEILRRGMKVELDLEVGLPEILADRVGLQQVLVNLLTNAADAMTHLSPEARQITVRSRGTHSRGVMVSVEDVGTGLSAQAVDRMFEAFFTTRPGGIGMGLAICRSLVEAHGGQIRAVSSPGEGTRIDFTLPAGGEP